MRLDQAMRKRRSRPGTAKACSEEVEIFSAHDVEEFERLSGRSTRVPADKMTYPLRATGGI